MRAGGPNNRRPRGRHHNGGNNGSNNSNGNGGGNPAPASMGQHNNNRPRSVSSLRTQNFDSNCVDLRVRGNAWQVYEKYQALARDATGAGDRVAAENYMQHAEHYYRIIEAINEATAAEQPQPTQRVVQPTYSNQQPDMPNYFVPNGNVAPPPGAPVTSNAEGSVQPDSSGHASSSSSSNEAEVQHRSPAPSPFFTPDEMDDSGPQSLVAQR